jgi:hypothetical protein
LICIGGVDLLYADGYDLLALRLKTGALLLVRF